MHEHCLLAVPGGHGALLYQAISFMVGNGMLAVPLLGG